MSVALHAVEEGSGGTPALLVHAIGCDHHMWDEVAADLARSRRVIRADLRGHGASPVAPGPCSLDALAQDLATLLDRRGVERVDLVGLSLGGMVGQAFALAHAPRLRRLILANTTSGYGPEGRAMWEARARAVDEGGMAAILDMAMGRYFSAGFRAARPEVVARIAQQFLATDPQGYASCCAAIADLDFAARLASITAPTLVIAGGDDVATTPGMSAAIAERISGARLEVVPGVAHLGAVEAPAAYSRAIRTFLDA